MDMIFVVPAKGGRVRQPERHHNVMPEEGAFVPRNSFYERLLVTGDVSLADPPADKQDAAKRGASEPIEKAEPAPSETEAQSSGRSRRAAATQEG